MFVQISEILNLPVHVPSDKWAVLRFHEYLISQYNGIVTTHNPSVLVN